MKINNESEPSTLGIVLGWLAMVITCLSSLASVVFAPTLFLSDFSLLLGAIAAAKRCFTPVLISYGIWLLTHFGIHQYHLVLLDTVNTAHPLVVFDIVIVNVIFFTGLIVGEISLEKRLSFRNRN
ncbi:MAG: hypothetical protein OXG05_03580 [Gammaproteobacteria bacterium]|nr:hypothetical protein [Gammaproteobacteria bacterium]